MPRPDIALLLDLAHGGQPPLAVLLGVTLDAMIHQQEDHIGGQTEILVQAEKLAHGG